MKVYKSFRYSPSPCIRPKYTAYYSYYTATIFICYPVTASRHSSRFAVYIRLFCRSLYCDYSIAHYFHFVNTFSDIFLF